MAAFSDFSVPDHILTFVISLLVTALVVHVAASLAVAGKQSYWQAILTAFFGSLLAGLVLLGAGEGWLAVGLAVAAWALVAALVYRTSWLHGALIGVLAWVLWAIVVAIMRAV